MAGDRAAARRGAAPRPIDALGAEVVAFGPLPMRRRDVYALLIGLGRPRRQADFFAFARPALASAEPVALADARAAYGDLA